MSTARIVEKKLGKLGIKLTGAAPKPIKVPDHLFELPGVWTLCGKRGSGKSTALASLLRDYKAAGFLDRLWIISPTIKGRINQAMFSDLAAPEDCHTELEWSTVRKVLDQVEDEGLEWRLHEKRVKVYERLQNYMRDGTMDRVPPKLLLEADALGMLESEYLERPTHKWGHSPRLFLVYDDVQSSKIMSPSSKNPCNNLAISNRHCGDGVGLTIVYCVQSYTAHSGLPRVLREQTTLFLLWRMASEARRQQLALELANDLDDKEFLAVLDAGTDEADNHSFVCIDFQAPRERRYRKCFDTILQVERAPKGNIRKKDIGENAQLPEGEDLRAVQHKDT